jgi:Xaa-Pro aminopeptidase
VTFAGRRARVLDALGGDAALILAAPPALRVGRDTELRYTPDADLYYLTGCTEPEAVLVLRRSGDATDFTLFVRPRDAERELWTGPRGGVESARERYGADQTFAVAELGERLPGLVEDVHSLHARLPSGSEALDALIPGLLRAGRARRARHGRGPTVLAEPGLILDDMRLVKDAAEIERLRAAARVTISAFREALAVVRPGSGEADVEAALEAAFRRNGASGPAFPTIAAAGRNATVLHYIENGERLRAGELLLIDGGARVGQYCGDVSRTVPVSGRFTADQRRVYGIVHAARDAAIATARPGATIGEVHDAAHAVLVAGMRELGLVADGLQDEALRERVRTFFPHRTSHWLGLEVHDVGDYVRDDESRRLVEGMAFTVEPGLYVPVGSDAPAALRGIGIRIEDDVLIDRAGTEVLTAELPTGADELEALIG